MSADVLTPEQRSRCMSRIKGKNTGPELRLRKALWNRGVRYRLDLRIPGKPDMVFPKRRVAVFIDGCFWHGCPAHGVKPKTNAIFWKDKIERNQRRDNLVNAELQRQGWRVLRFWEHEVEESIQVVVNRIQDVLSQPPIHCLKDEKELSVPHDRG